MGPKLARLREQPSHSLQCLTPQGAHRQQSQAPELTGMWSKNWKVKVRWGMQLLLLLLAASAAGCSEGHLAPALLRRRDRN